MIVVSSEWNAHAATFRPKNFAAQVQLLTHQNGIFSLLRSAETLLNMIVSPAVMVVRCNIVAKLRQSCKLITIGQNFFCPSPLPFGGSTVLSLTRGPAGNRTTTGRSTEDQSVQEGFQKLQTRFDFQKTLSNKTSGTAVSVVIFGVSCCSFRALARGSKAVSAQTVKPLHQRAVGTCCALLLLLWGECFLL